MSVKVEGLLNCLHNNLLRKHLKNQRVVLHKYEVHLLSIGEYSILSNCSSSWKKKENFGPPLLF